MCSDGTASYANEILCNFALILVFQCARQPNDVVHQLRDTRDYLHLARGGVFLIHKWAQSVHIFLSMQSCSACAFNGHDAQALSRYYVIIPLLQWNRLVAQRYSPKYEEF